MTTPSDISVNANRLICVALLGHRPCWVVPRRAGRSGQLQRCAAAIGCCGAV